MGVTILLSLPCHRIPCVVLCSKHMLKSLALALAASVSMLSVSAVQAASGCGTASHYGVGDGFAWKTMANGRPMDPSAMTTAHPWLPLGSRVQVTNRSNGSSVVVRVTDRGPFFGGRVLDLSHGAFSRIANPSRGVANVCYTRIS